MALCPSPETGPKAGKRWGFWGARVKMSQNPHVYPLRNIDKSPFLTHFKGVWKFFSKKGPEAAPTQRKICSD